jgi:hypothetical protein
MRAGLAGPGLFGCDPTSTLTSNQTLPADGRNGSKAAISCGSRGGRIRRGASRYGKRRQPLTSRFKAMAEAGRLLWVES